MKKLIVSAFVLVAISACHYGQDEAKKTLERNEEYKNEKAEHSVNRAGEYGNPNQTTVAATVADTSTTTDTTTAK